MDVALVDYGMGNLNSVRNALEHVGARVRRVEDRAALEDAGAIVLPGVGAFGQGRAELGRRGLDEGILRAIERGRPLLGICLGLQLLADRSFEQGEHFGLGCVPGDVVRFELSSDLRVPHIGWNDVAGRGPLFRGLPPVASFYFVHSYYIRPTDVAMVCGTTGYGVDFCSAVARQNVLAVQFHPEKSHKHGLALLKNFLDFARSA